MNLNDGGYSTVQYTPSRLRAKAAQLAELIPKAMAETGADAVCVTGKSGIALAFATLMLVDFPLVVVRKRGEKTHGSMIEGENGTSFTKYLILDDFIASGMTLDSIVDIIDQQAEVRNVATPKLVGVVLYSSSRESFRGLPVYNLEA